VAAVGATVTEALESDVTEAGGSARSEELKR
jgi:hypothetical protein